MTQPEPTPEMLAKRLEIARRIVVEQYRKDFGAGGAGKPWYEEMVQKTLDGDHDHMFGCQIALAAIAETAELCAKLAETDIRLSHDGFDLTGFLGENNRCRSIATAIRNKEFLR